METRDILVDLLPLITKDDDHNKIFDLSGRSLLLNVQQQDDNDDGQQQQQRHQQHRGNGTTTTRHNHHQREIDDKYMLLRLEKLKILSRNSSNENDNDETSSPTNSNNNNSNNITTTNPLSTTKDDDDDDEIIQIDKFLIQDVVFTCTSADVLMKTLTYIKDVNYNTENGFVQVVKNSNDGRHHQNHQNQRRRYYYKLNEIIFDNVRQNYEFYLVLKHVLNLGIFSQVKFDQLNYEWTFEDDERIRARNNMARQQQQQQQQLRHRFTFPTQRNENNGYTRFLYGGTLNNNLRLNNIVNATGGGGGGGGADAAAGINNNNNDDENHSLAPSEHSSMPGLVSRNGNDHDSYDDDEEEEEESDYSSIPGLVDRNDPIDISDNDSEDLPSSLPGLVDRRMDNDSEDEHSSSSSSSSTNSDDDMDDDDDDIGDDDNENNENNHIVQIDLGNVVPGHGRDDDDDDGNGNDHDEAMENNNDDDDDDENSSLPGLVEREQGADDSEDEDEDDASSTGDSIPELIKPRMMREETVDIIKDYTRGDGGGRETMTTMSSASRSFPMDTALPASTYKNCDSLQSLILHRVQLDEDGWMALGQCLVSSPLPSNNNNINLGGCQLKELHLTNVRFGRGQTFEDIDTSFSNMLVGLTENTSLQKFTLQMVRDVSDTQLARLVQALPKTTIQELSLDETPWHEETIQAITSHLLRNPDCNLRALSLASPLPSRRIWFELFFPSSSTSQFTLPLMQHLLNGLTLNTTLQRLCLKSCGLDNGNFNLLMTTLSKASKQINLQELDLSGNFITSFDITRKPTPRPPPQQRNPDLAAVFDNLLGGGDGLGFDIGVRGNDIDEESSNSDDDSDSDDSDYEDSESDDEDNFEDPTTFNNVNMRRKKKGVVIGTNSRLRKLNMAENPIFSTRLSIWLRYSRTQEDDEAETTRRSIEQQLYICQLLQAFPGLGKLDGIEEMPRIYTAEIENILDMNDSGLRLLQQKQQLINNDGDETMADAYDGSGDDGDAGIDIQKVIPPLSLWSKVLERVASEESLAKYHEYSTTTSGSGNNGNEINNNAENNENPVGNTNESRAATAKRRQANAIYHLLQGPVFAARNSMY